MKWRCGILGFVIGISAFASPASADVVTDVLGCKGDPCVVRRSDGGFIVQFEAAARAINAGARSRVVIDGSCASACVLLADIARNRVCITKRAQLAFHKYGTPVGVANGKLVMDPQTREDPPHSYDIDSLVRARGGYPSQGFRVLKYNDIRHIWQTC